MEKLMSRSLKTLVLVAILTGAACTAPVVPNVTEQVEVVPTAGTAEATAVLPTAAPPTVTEQALPSTTPVAITELSAVGYTLPLVVQHVSETSAVVFIELAQAADGVLVVRS